MRNPGEVVYPAKQWVRIGLHIAPCRPIILLVRAIIDNIINVKPAIFYLGRLLYFLCGVECACICVEMSTCIGASLWVPAVKLGLKPGPHNMLKVLLIDGDEAKVGFWRYDATKGVKRR